MFLGPKKKDIIRIHYNMYTTEKYQLYRLQYFYCRFWWWKRLVKQYKDYNKKSYHQKAIIF